MAAFSYYSVGAFGLDFVEGSLYNLLPEFKSFSQKEFYRKSAIGWSICPLGYSFLKFASGTQQYVMPGFHLAEGPSPKRKFPNYALRFSKSQVEAVASDIQAIGALVDIQSAELVGNLTHDLRALSGQIYNAAEMLNVHLNNMNYPAVSKKSDTVMAAQQMLSLRLDMLDYSTGLALEKDPERIPVYKKFDKVVKCFEANASLNEIKLDIQGPSSGFTYGAPVFELVPFVLVENAMKYSPKRSIVVVKISDFDMYVDAHVQSYGPRIAKSEFDRLFEQGFRGEAARKTGKSGSGVGLFAAQSLLRGSFSGDLSVAQEPIAITMDNREFWRTTFSCRVPRVA